MNDPYTAPRAQTVGVSSTTTFHLVTLGLLGFGVLYDLLTLTRQVSERNQATS